MQRRHFLSSLAAAPFAAAAGDRPNFVILFTDDQRFDTIRALGNREIHTPNMDRLAARGIAFTHASIMGGTQGAVCVPSRAMLMTGQSLFRAARNTGSTPGESATPERFVMMPEHLLANGYKTFITGKWHNGPRLLARCFNNGGNIFFGGMSDQNRTPVQDFDPTGAYPKSASHEGGKFSSELFADTAIAFLRSHKGPDPFFLYVPFTSPHDPRTAPKQFMDLYKPGDITLPPNFLPQHPFDNGELKVRDELLAPFPRTPEDTRRQIAEYYAMISEVDHQIGRILDTIDSGPFAKNTYVIFAGDNGLAVGQHGLFGKQNVYDHSVRVPLIITGPGIPAGRRSDAFTYHYDIYPTVCKLTGLPVPESVEGEDLAPLWKGQKKSLRDSVFYAYRRFQRSVRTRDWKLIRYTVNGQETIQLFHIAKDPWERTNLAGKPEHAAKEKELLAALADWQKRVRDPLL